jgi:hypothetical protein
MHTLLHQAPNNLSVEANWAIEKGHSIYHVTRNSHSVSIGGGSSSRFSFLVEGSMERIHHWTFRPLATSVTWIQVARAPGIHHKLPHLKTTKSICLIWTRHAVRRILVHNAHCWTMTCFTLFQFLWARCLLRIFSILVSSSRSFFILASHWKKSISAYQISLHGVACFFL